MEDLRCLFLQHNRLEKIENLEKFQKLTTLNMSHNFLSELTGLAGLPNLHTLIVSHNKFCGVKDLEELIGCKEVAVLDLSNNSIDESEVIQQVLHHMENLKVLTYMGNPIVRKTKDYRLVKTKNDSRLYFGFSPQAKVLTIKCIHSCIIVLVKIFCVLDFLLYFFTFSSGGK